MSEKSLVDWTRKNEIWKIEKWKTFLRDFLTPLYKSIYILRSIHEFLREITYDKRLKSWKLLSEVSEDIRDKIEVCVLGGLEEGEDYKTAFAYLAYLFFGIYADIGIKPAEDFRRYADMLARIVKSTEKRYTPRIIVEDRKYSEIYNLLCKLLNYLVKRLDVDLSELKLEYISGELIPIEYKGMNPADFLPEPGILPRKLVDEIIKRALNSIRNLLVGVNEYVTLVFYSRCLPFNVFMDLLGCRFEEAVRLADFLGLSIRDISNPLLSDMALRISEIFDEKGDLKPEHCGKKELSYILVMEEDGFSATLLKLIDLCLAEFSDMETERSLKEVIKDHFKKICVENVLRMEYRLKGFALNVLKEFIEFVGTPDGRGVSRIVFRVKREDGFVESYSFDGKRKKSAENRNIHVYLDVLEPLYPLISFGLLDPKFENYYTLTLEVKYLEVLKEYLNKHH